MFTILIDLLYPKHCPVCLDALPPGKKLICEPCRKKIRYVRGAVCFKCGKPIEDESREYCKNCESRMPGFVKGLAWAEYSSFYTRQMLSEVKYHGNRQLLDYPCLDFSERIKSEVASWHPDVLIPVPVHKSRRLSRGYNQAEEIAVRLSSHLQIPVDSELLLRTEKTEAQKNLSGSSRALNLFGAFSVNSSRKNELLLQNHGIFPYQNVILIDDIYTTGATAECCTQALLHAGVSSVYFLSLAIGRDSG